jgi:hypothetical protein
LVETPLRRACILLAINQNAALWMLDDRNGLDALVVPATSASATVASHDFATAAGVLSPKVQWASFGASYKGPTRLAAMD